MSTFGLGLRALVVDDEEVVREMLEMVLETAGFEVELREDLEGGLKALEDAEYDLLLTDKNLPDGNGLEIAKRVADERRDTQVLVITGYASVSSAVEAIQNKVADYVTKPFDITDLRARIQRAVDTQALRRENRRLVEELRHKNRILEEMSVRDPLTNLFNHGYFQETLEREIARSRRSGLPVSLVFVDIDNFKEINDSRGHQAGDEVLVFFADLLLGGTRLTDFRFRLRDQDVAARYGGDEFALVLPDTHKEGASTMAERLRLTLEAFDFAARDLPPMSLSLGVASFPGDAESRTQLIEAADAALYAAKTSGRNRVVGFTREIGRFGADRRVRVERELQLMQALDQTIEERKFAFHFQPVAELESWKVVGHEALLRPEDPLFPHPPALLETAERSGRVHLLGRALRSKLAESLPKLPEGADLFLNLHPLDLNDPELASVEPFFRDWTERIILEITETTEIRDFDRAKGVIRALKDAGFRVAIDDFGAGYSGINNLALLEPDLVKLDLRLVRGVVADPRRSRLLRHLIDYCRGEGMLVVAEGIENADDLHRVMDLGCTLGQGYLLARPQPEFAALLPKP